MTQKHLRPACPSLLLVHQLDFPLWPPTWLITLHLSDWANESVNGRCCCHHPCGRLLVQGDYTLAGRGTSPAWIMVTLSSQLSIPHGAALLLLPFPANKHPLFSLVILLSFTITAQTNPNAMFLLMLFLKVFSKACSVLVDFISARSYQHLCIVLFGNKRNSTIWEHTEELAVICMSWTAMTTSKWAAIKSQLLERWFLLWLKAQFFTESAEYKTTISS